MSFSPKVSVVIPVYNGSNYLKEAIDSALAQTYKNIEVLVINDGSKDDGKTEAIAKSYGDKIRYFKKENGGVATALNLGIEKMTGEYFSWLSHDDMYKPGKIKKQVEALGGETNPGSTIVACNALVLFDSGIQKKENIHAATFRYTDIFLATSAVVGVNGCALLIPKSALKKTGGFDVSLPVTQDYDLWFRLLRVCNYTLIEDHLVISRRHEGQDSVQKQKLCFEAGEELHYQFLRSIPYQRYAEYFRESDLLIEHYMHNFYAYRDGGYIRTSAMMLKPLLSYYSKSNPSKYSELFSSEIGRYLIGGFNVDNKKKPRILLYTNVWHRGGIERVLTVFLEEFCKDYECYLVIDEQASGLSLGFEIPKGVGVVAIKGQNVKLEILNYVSLLDIDIFIGNPNFSERFIDIYPILELTSTKAIAYNHGHFMLPYTTGSYLYPIALKMRETYESASSVVWLSKVACGIYNLNAQNGVYIPNPVQRSVGIKARNLNTKRALAVGRFDDEVKRIDRILLLFRALYSLDASYTLDIVGHCPLDMNLPHQGNITLSDFIEKYNIPLSSISFRGEQKSVASYYDRADLLLLGSRCEGFALVLTEALSAGIPCAAFYYLGVEEIIEDGINGWIGDVDDYAGFARKINDCMSDKNLYAQLSTNALESIHKFGVGSFRDRWSILIKSTLEDKPQSSVKLISDTTLSIDQLSKALVEQENALVEVIRDYQNKTPAVVYVPQGKESRVRKIASRLRGSILRDGVVLTIEKIIRKIIKRLKLFIVRKSGV